ncbi:hypothetical protein Ait01nite_099730 [Actinoplanes italicus]|uniref:Uncharacterized protein n=1 Tax=Actinoplanes italicus TaxID=113567 RepID=A0A2T0KGE3_9ACTN|nr:hypothetical protein [Actinoplanes italicus]PRX22514.1 hypothetical protein CLV67_10441 [Actinoplanes italicus]GIE36928.1 hypothetical protein Ait01nite_099730 [Actinoplanes italicus]
MTDPHGPVLGEPPAPPPEVWAAVLARALDPDAAPIAAAGLVPGPAEYESPDGLTGDDTDEWAHPDGGLTGDVSDDHDDAHDPPSADPWSSGPEPEMY